jgi:two-component system, NtrC family, response regulator HydG
VSGDSTAPEQDYAAGRPQAAGPEVFALVIVWCREEPWRVGETLLVPPGPALVVGRGPSEPGEPPRASFGQQRPRSWQAGAPFAMKTLSRRQLLVSALDSERLLVENQGKSLLLQNGQQTLEAACSAGDILQVGGQLLLLCTRRPQKLASERSTEPEFPFGEPDAHGIVGESPAVWALRERIEFVARRPGHVLIRGSSGSGKELVAQAIHVLSGSGHPLIARNAATIPDSLVDAELFGSARNYPNAGMPERPGLIGQADGSSLFLDEIGELTPASQAHLLRVLDRGEYQRLGDSRSRTSQFRLLAATSRHSHELRDDFAARFKHQLSVADLNARREDIPLLVNHLLRSAAGAGDEAALRVFPEGNLRGYADLPIELTSRLVTRAYRTNVRELDNLLAEALTPSAVEPQAVAEIAEVSPESAEAPSPERIQSCLDANNGMIERSFRELGLSSRFALLRLIKKHRLVVRRRPGG